MSEPSGRKTPATPPRDFTLVAFMPYRVVALGRQLSQRLAASYRNEDIAIPEWRVLAVIAEAGSAGMAARDVASMTPMDKMAVSRAVASLEGKGLALRKPHPDDRRLALVCLTGKGAALFNRIAALARAFEEDLLSVLDADERAQFGRLLEKLEKKSGVVAP